MKIKTRRFGELDIASDKIIQMIEGLLGFPCILRYTILEDPEEAPFKWFQALDDENLAFVIINPNLFKPDYQVKLDPHQIPELKLQKAEDAIVYAIVVVTEDPQNMTANLQGPIIINTENRLAKQIVLQDDLYSIRHRIFPLPE